MNFWYSTNLAISAVLLFWPVWFARRIVRIGWVNPISVQALVNLPFECMKLFAGPLVLIDGGLSNVGFQFAVLMNTLLTIAQIAGTLTFFHWAHRLRIERLLPFKYVFLSKRDLRLGSAVFFLIYVVAFVLLASASIGVIEWLENPRTGYQQYRVGEGHWYAIAISALAVSCMASFLTKPKPFWILAKTMVFVAASYALGTKGVMLYIFTAGVVMLSYLGSRQVISALLVGAPVVIVLLAYNLFLALGDSFELNSLVEYFEYYKNAADYYAGVLNGSIQLFHGEVFLSSFWQYVPRALYPDKPFVYGITHVNEIFFPGQAELTNTPAFGGAVEQYADFGILGVVLFGVFGTQALLNGVLPYLLFRNPKLNISKASLGAFMVLLVLAGPGFGLFFQGLLFWLLVAVVTFILGLIRRHTDDRQSAVRSVSDSS